MSPAALSLVTAALMPNASFLRRSANLATGERGEGEGLMVFSLVLFAVAAMFGALYVVVRFVKWAWTD
jgi:hypothetical protein